MQSRKVLVDTFVINRFCIICGYRFIDGVNKDAVIKIDINDVARIVPGLPSSLSSRMNPTRLGFRQ